VENQESPLVPRRSTRRHSFFAPLFLVPALVFSVEHSLLAVRVQHLEMEAIAGQAPRIVLGVVLDRTPVYDPSTNSVWTEYQISVQDQLKGSAPSTLALRFFGGEAEGHDEGIAGQLTLDVGDTYLLFLSDRPHHYAPVVGFAQGLYRAVMLPTGDGGAAVHFVSPEGVLLEVGENQRIVRTGPWAVQDGRLVPAPAPRSTALQAEPDLSRSDGAPAPSSEPQAKVERALRPATADDIRRLLIEPSSRGAR
jgi:hypothetical protein